jgi:hypothetical protein
MDRRPARARGEEEVGDRTVRRRGTRRMRAPSCVSARQPENPGGTDAPQLESPVIHATQLQTHLHSVVVEVPQWIPRRMRARPFHTRHPARGSSGQPMAPAGALVRKGGRRDAVGEGRWRRATARGGVNAICPMWLLQWGRRIALGGKGRQDGVSLCRCFLGRAAGIGSTGWTVLLIELFSSNGSGPCTYTF